MLKKILIGLAAIALIALAIVHWQTLLAILGIGGAATLEAARRQHKKKIKERNENLESKLDDIKNSGDSLSDRISKHNRGG